MRFATGVVAVAGVGQLVGGVEGLGDSGEQLPQVVGGAVSVRGGVHAGKFAVSRGRGYSLLGVTLRLVTALLTQGLIRGRATVRVQVRRVYEDPALDEGARVLVDRLWPRGVAKERLPLDRWAKDVAPSTELRTWYGHRPERFEEFRRRYLAELQTPPAADVLEDLRLAARQGGLTLLTATRDVPHSGAAVLAQAISGRL